MHISAARFVDGCVANRAVRVAKSVANAALKC